MVILPKIRLRNIYFRISSLVRLSDAAWRKSILPKIGIDTSGDEQTNGYIPKIDSIWITKMHIYFGNIFFGIQYPGDFSENDSYLPKNIYCIPKIYMQIESIFGIYSIGLLVARSIDSFRRPANQWNTSENRPIWYEIYLLGFDRLFAWRKQRFRIWNINMRKRKI